jgi:hypothetical protein
MNVCVRSSFSSFINDVSGLNMPVLKKEHERIQDLQPAHRSLFISICFFFFFCICPIWLFNGILTEVFVVIHYRYRKKAPDT